MIGPVYLHAFDRNGRPLGRKVALAKVDYTHQEALYSLRLRLSELGRDVMFALNCEANPPLKRLECPLSLCFDGGRDRD